MEKRDYRQRLYESYFSTHYGPNRNPTHENIARNFPHFRHHLLRHFPPDRNAAIVELGCGYGALLSFLSAQGYRNIAGVDLSPEQVEAAARLGNQVVESDMLSYLQPRAGQFDAIIAIDVLEHVRKEDMLDTLEAIARALKPTGRFIAQTVNADGPFSGRYRYGDFTHELAFTAQSISQVLRAAGFTRIAVYPIPPVVHGVKSALRWVVWQGIRLMLTAYLVAESGVTRGHILTQNLIVVASKLDH